MSFSVLPQSRGTRLVTLSPSQFAAARDFCQAHGPDGVMAGARIAQAAKAAVPFGEVWALERRDNRHRLNPLQTRDLEAVAWAGGNLIPVGADARAAQAFASLARSRGARYASIVGQAEAVRAIWDSLAPSWPQPRSVRRNQPCMELTGPALTQPDPLVRPATSDMLEQLVPACRAMFTEELGFPPPGPEAGYRAHVAAQVERGNILARTDPGSGEVIFKAELGSECGPWVQVQGVWTNPAWRGRGVAQAGMSATVAEARRRDLTRVCLYVNDFNFPAIAVYRKVGFQPVGAWATVMF
ncbi:MAG: GNAT family N-acetyltransferase [Bifidobacteriaceae bacterium]|nr:GNAT family N-acetyltransferase [Bifidobacteriaceae bacterium]